METLWTLPVASTALLGGVVFNKGMGRLCTLSFSYEGESESVSGQLRFQGCEAFRVTYSTACTADNISAAYDKLVDLGETDWLREVRTITARTTQNVSRLRHLMIYFDDGPAYEFVCRDFESVTMKA